MRFIRHRINKLTELATVNEQHGCEIDLRTCVSKMSHIHLSHDPWVEGDSLSDWLYSFSKRKIKGTLIFNTKEDGLEGQVIDLCEQNKIENYFFLDTAAPTQIKNMNGPKAKHFAIRVSKYESVDYAMQFKGIAKWIWLDCFEGIPMPSSTLQQLETHFDVCLVSPELQKLPVEAILKFKSLFPTVHSVCTKRPDLWMINE